MEAILASSNGVLAIRHHRSLRTTVWRLTRAQALVRVFPGVYVAAEDADKTGVWLAALTAWKPDGVIAGLTAHALHRGELSTSVARMGRVEVHRPVRTRDRSSVVWKRRVHAPASRVTRMGVSALSVAASAVDRAAHDDGSAIDDVLRVDRLHPESLLEHAAAYRRTPGNAVRRRVVAASATCPFSFGERELHRLLQRHRVTGWVANQPIHVGGRIVVPDVRFVDRRLIIEFDGREFHANAARFESDRQRQNLLVTHGFLVLRFTWAMLRDDPQSVVDLIRSAYMRASAA